MAKAAGKTFSTDLEIRKLVPEEKHYWVKDLCSDGLFLEVSPAGGKTWQYRYSINGKQERVKLGKYPRVSLNQARIDRATYEENFVAKGITKAQVKLAKEQEQALNITFREFSKKYADRYIVEKIKNEKTMLAYLDNDILPFIGDYPIQQVSIAHVEKLVMRKLNQGFPASAHQIRQLVKRIFDYALDIEYVAKTPVKKSLLEMQLVGKPKQRDLTFDEITSFYTFLFQQNSARATKLGLLLALLVLIRKSELTQAKWSHIDFENGVWTIPNPKGDGDKLRTVRPFEVYISSQVKAILLELKQLAGNSEYILPGRTPDKPISRTVFNMAINTNLKKMGGLNHFSVHDLRRTAATRLNDLGYNSDIIEKCLNHKMSGIREVYNKATYETQRREMMQEWSNIIFKAIPLLEYQINF